MIEYVVAGFRPGWRGHVGKAELASSDVLRQRFDHKRCSLSRLSFLAAVAQWPEHWIVDPGDVGSTPIRSAISFCV